MTNKEINDFLKEIITWFREYRDQRPITKEETKAQAWLKMSEILDKYGKYDKKGNALNDGIIKVAIWLYRELQTAEGELK